MRISILDAKTLGEDISLDGFSAFGDVTVYQGTTAEETEAHIQDADVLVLNKVKLNASNLPAAKHLRLICLAATGYDNVDLDYCRLHGIGVCNVKGYSTGAVAQLTVTMALYLLEHLGEYRNFVVSGEYTKSGVANRLIPVYHEICGKTWGIVGYGNIGKAVAKVAEAFGCRVLVHKRTPISEATCVGFDEICRESDILSLHTPLNEETRGMLDEAHIKLLKPEAIVINVARGGGTDEVALAKAVEEGRIGGIGVDVYSAEPMPADHPFQKIKAYPNVCLTPHMAWGGKETRIRLIDEICRNIDAFRQGERRNRVD